ncbi:isoform b [Moniliophthora roreri MCA 2997]|uniref:Isoform b n=1 Tax=Moniliophthora roreri (strain MCA 2997) TaxID=1381753 RepID=V2YV75_MONRO|nr:isoform b [Moniliophthora roreri MCA 2997]
MSALSAALAACNPPHVAVATLVDDSQVNVSESLTCPSTLSNDGSCDQSSTCSLALQLSPILPNQQPLVRPNEHLAVLMPKHLWKPDSLATSCDSFFCRVSFTLFERRHHCRKCGGVFCKACTSRMTPLLDTSKLPFLNPPRNTPISSYESPESPIINARICDDCYDQLHGCPSTPRTPELVRPSLPILTKRPLSPSSGSRASSPSSSSPRTPPNGLGLVLPSETASLRRSRSRCSNPDLRRRATMRGSSINFPDEERSFGELDSYPLRRSSVLCKATGGGRWEPKQDPVFDGQRVPIPGGKAPYEIRLEKELEEERLRRENPVIRDGEFQYRFPREPEVVLPRSLSLSTF